MFYTVKGEKLTIQVKSTGAELVSVRNNGSGQEYLWNADPAHWARTSPILFPFVGRVRNGVYRHQGKTYEMGAHGFVREMEFTLKEQKKNSLWLTLKDTEETRRMYPFCFTLDIGFEIEDVSVRTRMRVTNDNDEVMYFALGGHPAIVCPLHKGGKRTESYLLFDREEEMVCSEIVLPSGLAGDRKTTYRLEHGLLPITTGMFDQDALVAENNQIHSVSLCGPDREPYARVDFDAPLFGIWSMPSDEAAFICVEPWYGRCDKVDFDGELKDREWENALAPGGVFEGSFTIHTLKG